MSIEELLYGISKIMGYAGAKVSAQTHWSKIISKWKTDKK
jgi:hypothetical protein